jgi:hypothetical protein
VEQSRRLYGLGGVANLRVAAGASDVLVSSVR